MTPLRPEEWRRAPSASIEPSRCLPASACSSWQTHASGTRVSTAAYRRCSTRTSAPTIFSKRRASRLWRNGRPRIWQARSSVRTPGIAYRRWRHGRGLPRPRQPTGRTVAIKVLLSHIAADEPARERFEREARVVARLSHPHICTLHDISTTTRRQAGPGALPRHGVSGWRDARRQAAKGALRSTRRSSGPFRSPLHSTLRIEPASSTGIWKPRNVMLTSAGAKLVDFGIAKATASPALGRR